MHLLGDGNAKLPIKMIFSTEKEKLMYKISALGMLGFNQFA